MAELCEGWEGFWPAFGQRYKEQNCNSRVSAKRHHFVGSSWGKLGSKGRSHENTGVEELQAHRNLTGTGWVQKSTKGREARRTSMLVVMMRLLCWDHRTFDEMKLFSKSMAQCKSSSPHVSDRSGLSVVVDTIIPKPGALWSSNPLGKLQKSHFWVTYWLVFVAGTACSGHIVR